MRERWIGALVGMVLFALVLQLTLIPWGLWLGIALCGTFGWGLGGYLRHLRRLAERDPLTGLANRRPLERRLEVAWDRAKRCQRPLSLVFLEIDDFGAVNKQYGHLMGDEALLAVVRAMRTGIRRTDLLARWGGDEFVLLLPETELSQALVLAERIRDTVERCQVRDKSTAVHVTVSGGVAGLPGTAQKASDLLRQAVEAQQRAKERKNAVMAVS